MLNELLKKKKKRKEKQQQQAKTFSAKTLGQKQICIWYATLHVSNKHALHTPTLIPPG